MLKKYYRRKVNQNEEELVASQMISCISVIETEKTEDVEVESIMESIISKPKEMSMHFPVLLAKESVQDVKINAEPNSEQSQEVRFLLDEYPDVLTDVPDTTDNAEHEIVVTTEKPIRSKPYPVPFSLKKIIKQEIDNML